MVILGLVLILVAAVATLGAVFLVDGDAVQYFGAEVPPLTLFLAGALSLLFVALGFRLLTSGTKRSLRTRKEHKEEERRLQAERDRADDDRSP